MLPSSSCILSLDLALVPRRLLATGVEITLNFYSVASQFEYGLDTGCLRTEVFQCFSQPLKANFVIISL